MKRGIPFRKIKQARAPVSKKALSALAYGFLLAVCQSEDWYKGCFFRIKIKLPGVRDKAIYKFEKSKIEVYREVGTAGSLVKIFLFIKKRSYLWGASCLQWRRLNSIERKERLPHGFGLFYTLSVSRPLIPLICRGNVIKRWDS